MMDWTFRMSGFSYQQSFNEDSLTAFMLNYRLSVIAKYIDDEFIKNPEYIANARRFSNGNIREDVLVKLKQKYDITDTSVNITNFIDLKCIELIRAIYV
jgi:hypothetical protein